jgi:large subunit ribosomal protein L29
MTRATEFYGMDADELVHRLVEARRELLNLRFQLATGQLDNVAQIKNVRRDVARVLTVLREMEIAEAEGIAFEPPAVKPAQIEAQRRDEERAALVTSEPDEEVLPEDEEDFLEEDDEDFGPDEDLSEDEEPLELDEADELEEPDEFEEAEDVELETSEVEAEEPGAARRPRLRRSRRSDEGEPAPTRTRRRSRRDTDEER